MPIYFFNLTKFSKYLAKLVEFVIKKNKNLTTFVAKCQNFPPQKNFKFMIMVLSHLTLSFTTFHDNNDIHKKD